MTRLVVPSEIDQTTFDFDALLDRIERSIPTVFPDWTDQSRANIGRIFVEGMCFIGDVLHDYANGQSREAHLTTCTQMPNAMRHARKLAYSPAGRSAATVTMRLTLSEIQSLDCTAAAGSVIRAKSSTTDVVRVQLLSDLTVTAGNLYSDASAENSESQSHSFVSDGTKDQRVELPNTPFLEVVSVEDSVGTWGEVSNFLDSTATDRHYRRLISEDDKALLVFGDGTNGAVPLGTVSIAYKTGGGAITIDAGDLEIPEFSLTDASGTPVAFTITNPAQSTGGSDRETVDEIRVNAPASLAATNRSVTKEDFETNAKRIDGIARALMLTSDQDTGIAENTGQLYVVAKGSLLSSGRYAPATPTAAQKSAVQALIDNTYPPTITFVYDVLDPVFYTVNVVARVLIAQGYSAANADTLIRSALADLFAALKADLTENTDIDFGYNYKDAGGDPASIVPWSDIFNAVRDAEGVRLVDKSTFQPYDNVSIGLNQFPRLGTVTLLDHSTGLALV